MGAAFYKRIASFLVVINIHADGSFLVLQRMQHAYVLGLSQSKNRGVLLVNRRYWLDRSASERAAGDDPGGSSAKIVLLVAASVRAERNAQVNRHSAQAYRQRREE